jgi:hypothetical protein
MFEYSHVVCSYCDKVFEKKEVDLRSCPECGHALEKLTVIASWGICNTASLNVFKIVDASDTKMLVAINDHKPEWCTVEHTVDPERDEEEDLVSAIQFHGDYYFLDECMKV